jgi:hypothetical protein
LRHDVIALLPPLEEPPDVPVLRLVERPRPVIFFREAAPPPPASRRFVLERTEPIGPLSEADLFRAYRNTPTDDGR